MKALITAGGTREPIDGIRSITNTSSGRTGATIAKYFSSQGWNVTLLTSAPNYSNEAKFSQITFDTYDELDKNLSREVQQHNYQAIIHLAAVSDYGVEKVCSESGKAIGRSGKISSDQDRISIHLKKRPKLLRKIRQLCKQPSFIVGFKLTQTMKPEERQSAIEKIIQPEFVDCIVHNDLNEIEPDKEKHLATIYQNSEKPIKVENKKELAKALEKIARGKQ